MAMSTIHDHDRQSSVQGLGAGPSSAWVQRIADWIAKGQAPEAADIARDVAAVARRMTFEPSPGAAVISLTWLVRLADWVARDPRPQAADIARQLRRWAADSWIIHLPE